jgi:serine/threonine-protein kinase
VSKARRLRPLRARQTLGKYRIERRLASGGFADVFRAYDTIEGVRVALKVPFALITDDETLELFRREARLTARLDHPNILPIKNADFIDGRFVIVSALGKGTLAQRMEGRMSAETALDYTSQMLEALAHAHEARIVHCDVKPENFILFPGDRLRLTDFGIAKVMMRTLRAAGTGTVGYLAPEQAMGKPSFRSDVFSLGVVIWELFSGDRPEWPYEWPPYGLDRIKRKLHPEMIALLRRSLELAERKRFPDAVRMLAAFERIRSRAINPARRKRKRTTRRRSAGWKEIRRREFRRRFGRLLETRHECARCGGPVSESMTTCPWCGGSRRVHRDETRFPARCPRCKRGVKLDWKFCPWCYGPGIGPLSDREYSDVRYVARCGNPACSRKELMPFMKYCPWCRRKVQRAWKIEGSRDRCSSCGWGTLKEYWKACPWCGHRTGKT